MAESNTTAKQREPFNLFKFTRNAIIIAAVIGLTVWFVVVGVVPNVFPKNFGVVEAGSIYRSGKLTPAAFRKVINEREIRTIVDFGAWEPGTREDRRAQRVADAMGVERIVFDLEGDATGDPAQYLEALRIVNDPANHPILVHCGAGSERTGCFFMLYRTIVQDEPVDEAFAEAQDFRHDPERNPKMKPTFDAIRGPIEEAFESGGELVAPEGGWGAPRDDT